MLLSCEFSLKSPLVLLLVDTLGVVCLLVGVPVFLVTLAAETPGLICCGDAVEGEATALSESDALVARPATGGVADTEAEAVALRLEGLALRLRETSSSSSVLAPTSTVWFCAGLARLAAFPFFPLADSGELALESVEEPSLPLADLGVLIGFSGDDSEAELLEDNPFLLSLFRPGAFGLVPTSFCFATLKLVNFTTGLYLMTALPAMVG